MIYCLGSQKNDFVHTIFLYHFERKNFKMTVKTFCFGAMEGKFAFGDSVNCFVGKKADSYLSAIGIFLGAWSKCDDLGGETYLHADILIDGKNYDVCLIYGGECDHLVAVNFVEGAMSYSLEDTKEYIERRKECSANDYNVFIKSRYTDDLTCGESKKLINAFNTFLSDIKERTAKGDNRPILIYGFFERIDESIDTAPFINALAETGRQIFISVCNENYPCDRLRDNRISVFKS